MPSRSSHGDDKQTPAEQAMRRLAKARRAREKAEAAEIAAVADARAAGVSWTALGKEYGVSKQGAQQRFKHGVDALKSTRKDD